MDSLYEKLYNKNIELQNTINAHDNARRRAKTLLGYDRSISIDNVFKDHLELQSKLKTLEADNKELVNRCEKSEIALTTIAEDGGINLTQDEMVSIAIKTFNKHKPSKQD